jgi:hypothetical protein
MIYESLENKSIECKFCDYVGEFKYEWTEDAFLVKCPSCMKVNFEVKKEKVDALVKEIINDSMEVLRKSKKWEESE